MTSSSRAFCDAISLASAGDFGKLYAAAFAAAAGVDLGLNDDNVGAKFLRRSFGLLGRSSDDAARNRNAVFL